MSENQKARAAVLVGNFFFGTSVIAVKHISPALMDPIALTAVRVSVTTLLFWLLYAAKPVSTGISKNDYRLLFVCAIAGITLNQTFSMRGMSLTSPIHASLLVLITPITITLQVAATGRKAVSQAGRPNGYRFSFWDEENVLKLGSGDSCTISEYTKTIQLYTSNG